MGSSEEKHPPEKIKVFDRYGRELLVDRETWRNSVLPGSIKAHWNSADSLYGVLVSAVNDGFASDILGAAEQLNRLEHGSLRATCLYAIALKGAGRLKQSEDLLRAYLSRNGANPFALYSLANVYDAKGERDNASAALWQALELDPNHAGALMSYAAAARKRGGDDAQRAVWRKVAELPGSWRARVYLAREDLTAGDVPNALAEYGRALGAAGEPAPVDLLMSVSGDVGTHRRLREAIDLVEPRYSAEVHGIQVGNNLIKAHLDLGEFDAAQRLVDQLYARRRPDYKKALDHWANEIAKGRISEAKPIASSEPASIALLSWQSPIWLDSWPDAKPLFEGFDAAGATLAVLGSTAETVDQSVRVELSDAPGRVSRALPLFIAEQIFFYAAAHVKALIPFVVGSRSGYLLTGAPTKDDSAGEIARRPDVSADWIVTAHIKAAELPWSVEVRLVRGLDADCVFTRRISFDESDPNLNPESLRELCADLAASAGLRNRAGPALYELASVRFPAYLSALEGLLTFQARQRLEHHGEFAVSVPRAIADRALFLAVESPANVPVRLLLLQTWRGLRALDRAIAAEYVDRLALLQKEKPLPEPAQTIVSKALSEES